MIRLIADPLWRAWGALVGLGFATTAAAWGIEAGVAPTALGAAILGFAFLKARLILLRYLGLERVPAWRRGFLGAIGLYLLLLLGLYLVPAL